MNKTLAVLRGLWIFLAFAIALVSMQYFFFAPGEGGFADQSEVYAARPEALWLHVGPAILALAVGPFQLSKKLRRRRPAVHRTLGWIYVVAVVAGSIGGFALASTAFGGAVSTWGFRGLAVTWLVTTVAAVAFAVRNNFVAHRRWMIRSFAVTSSAITLRLLLPFAPMMGYEFVDGYRIAAWACWLVNLVAVEIYLARRPRMSAGEWKREPVPVPAAA